MKRLREKLKKRENMGLMDNEQSIQKSNSMMTINTHKNEETKEEQPEERSVILKNGEIINILKKYFNKQIIIAK